MCILSVSIAHACMNVYPCMFDVATVKYVKVQSEALAESSIVMGSVFSEQSG